MSKNKIADYLQQKEGGKSQNLLALEERCETAKNNTMVFLRFKMTNSGFPMFFLQHMSSLGQTHSVSVNGGENSEKHLRFHGIG